MTNLEPCPKCKDTKPWTDETWDRTTKMFGIYCEHCGYAETVCLTREEAVRIWNKRPIEDELRAELETNLDRHMNELSDLKETKGKLADAKDVLIDISQSAGNPDPKDACRIIIGIARRAIIDIESKSLW